MNRVYYYGIGFAFLSAALFAIRPILVKLAYLEGIESTPLITLRMLFSAPLYAGFLLLLLQKKERRQRLNKTTLLMTILCGLLGYYGASFLDLVGLQYVSAQLGRMVLYIYPTFVILLGALFFSTPITKRTLFCLALAYSGVAIIFGHDLDAFGSQVIKGAVFIIGSALCFSFYLLLSKNPIKQLGSNLFTCMALLAASAGIVLHFLLTYSVSDLIINQRLFYIVLLIAVFCTFIPTLCTTAAVARIGADKTGIIAMVGPVFTSLTAVLILHEEFTIYHIFGISLTMMGISLLRPN